MRTAIETPTFERQADDYWAEEERLDFLSWLAANPEAGDVIPGSEGARKVRWSLRGKGKRGGLRVIYFNYTEDGTLLLLMMYDKSSTANTTPNRIKRVLK